MSAPVSSHISAAPWGVLAEFNEPEALLAAARNLKAKGFRNLEAFTPFPVHGLTEALGRPKTRLQWIVFVCGLAGGTAGFAMQWYANVVAYPWNIGGRPLNSWPSFIPVTFELTVLCAAIGAVVSMFVLNGLPEPHHPVFAVDAFERASKDKFFLCVPLSGGGLSAASAKDALAAQRPEGIYEVPA